MSSPRYFTVTLYGDYTTGGRPWQISWHYEVAEQPGYSQLLPAAIYAALQDQFTNGSTQLATVLSTGVVARWLEITSTFPLAMYPFGGQARHIGSAGGTEDLLPEGDGPLILLRLAFPTLDYPRPSRVYWPGLSEGLNEDGKIDADYVNSLSQFWNDILTDSATIEGTEYVWNMCLLSPANEAKEPQLVDNAIVSDRVARLNRRMRVYQGRANP